MKRLVFISLIVLFSCSALFAASRLNIETDYRHRSLYYSNLDFDNSSSSDVVSYASQRLRLAVNGSFDTGSSSLGEQIDIFTTLQALDIIGTSTSVPFFSWQDETPYPNKDFLPFIEHAYIRMANLTTRYPLTLTIGRQPLEYGAGLIVSDNGMGLDAIRFNMQYVKKLNIDLFTSTIKKDFNKGDFTVSGMVVGGPWKESSFEFGYFMESDRSGSIYRQETSTPTKAIDRNFIDIRIGKIDDSRYYNIELAFQNGALKHLDESTISLNGGSAIVFNGGVFQKRNTGATVTYRMNISITSGDDIIDNLTDDDSSFSPALSKKFDGTELTGSGILMGVSPTATLLTVNRNNFSGFNYINFGANYSPSFGFEYGFDAFMFSASQCKYPSAPKTSNFEENILQSKYNMGSELNGFLRYAPSKYVSFTLSYARYTPPPFTSIWADSQTCDMYYFETTCKF